MHPAIQFLLLVGGVLLALLLYPLLNSVQGSKGISG